MPPIATISFIFGAILMSAGCFGGGLSIKDITIPKIGFMPRIASTGLGAFFMFVGFVYDFEPQPVPPSVTEAPAPTPTPEPPPSLLSPSPDDTFKAQVGTQLIEVSEVAGLGGYEMTHEPLLGQLTDNTSEPVTVNLQAGWIYSIIGVCDDDCGDLDLQLHDENGNEIATDFIEDAYPFVTVEPQWDGPFTLSVEMPSCAAPYCYYGIGVFGQ